MEERSEHRRVALRIRSTDCVLFDFDGPLCSLFAERTAKDVAARLTGALDDLGLLPGELIGSADPVGIFAATHRTPGATGAIAALLAEEEVMAAESALTTECSHELVSALARLGVRMAVTTNNSAVAAAAYLRRHALIDVFGEHIYGRAEDPLLLKPHPNCLLAAMKGLGAAPGDCLMIGDSPADVLAARSAGVRFVGYAPEPEKAEALVRAGAEQVVGHLRPLLEAAGGGAPTGGTPSSAPGR